MVVVDNNMFSLAFLVIIMASSSVSLSEVFPEFPLLELQKGDMAEYVNRSIKEAKPIKCKSEITSNIVTKMICEALSIKPPITDIVRLLRSLKEPMMISLLMLGRWAFIMHMIGMIIPQQFSNELLQSSLGCTTDIQTLGMFVQQTESYSPNMMQFQFRHFIFQEYFAAIYLIHQPIMSVMKFVSGNLFSLDKIKWGILEIYFGLARTGISNVAKNSLFHILSYICQSFDCSQPIINNQRVLLIMRCLNESQDGDLCRQAHYELFKSQTFLFKLCDVNNSCYSLAYYLASSIQDSEVWKVYCCSENFVIRKLATFVEEHSKKGKRKIIVQIDPQLTCGDSDHIVISLRSRDYILNNISEYFLKISSARGISFDGSFSKTFTSDSSLISTVNKVTLSSKIISSGDTSLGFLVPYGHQTTEQYRTQRQVENVTFYNMVKDLVAPQLQMYCPILVQTQYRKSDHIWFSFSRNMRYDFYEGVLITPIVPMHWVKVSF